MYLTLLLRILEHESKKSTVLRKILRLVTIFIGHVEYIWKYCL